MGWVPDWEPERPENAALPFYHVYFDEEHTEQFTYYIADNPVQEAWHERKPLENKELGNFDTIGRRNDTINSLRDWLYGQTIDWIAPDWGFLAMARRIRPTDVSENLWENYCKRLFREEYTFWKPLLSPQDIRENSIKYSLERILLTRIDPSRLKPSQSF